MSNTKTNPLGSILAFFFSGVFIVAAVWLFFHRQQALDQMAVWSYTPSSAVQAINQKVDFTENGRFIFYATKPQVEAQATFNKECPRQEAGSPILGCYTQDDHIYVYNLTNNQLDGMEEVTAAHEMLHAVWYRTSDADKAKLTAELEDAYAKIQDPSLKQRMDYYQRTEPGEFANELHSILGTEEASLGEPLESYYGQFFNRAKVLALHDKYNQVYVGLNNRADDLYAKMKTLSATIQTQSTTYDSSVAQLSADISAFNSRAESGSFTSQAQFNAERAALVRRSNALEATRTAINANIDTYNTDYNEYQAIAKQIEVLNDSLDSYKQLNQAPSV